MRYTKEPLSLDEQIARLKERGLVVNDSAKARRYLGYISYYRFSAYAYVFREFGDDGSRTDTFLKGACFDNILRLYQFDRELRVLCLDAIERIEVSIRATMCLHMATKYGDSHWHLDPTHFKQAFNHPLFLERLAAEFAKSSETFVSHYKFKYGQPELPPAWVAIELLSMGNWSRAFAKLSKREDRIAISDHFSLHPETLKSWLHCINYLRNLCAHHCRLWNRTFTLRLQR